MLHLRRYRLISPSTPAHKPAPLFRQKSDTKLNFHDGRPDEFVYPRTACARTRTPLPPQTLASSVSHLEVPDLERPQAGLLLLLPQEKLRLVLLRMCKGGDPYQPLHPGKATKRQAAGGAFQLGGCFLSMNGFARPESYVL